MNLHLVALPHVKLGTPDTHLCAYSAKVERFVRMMKDDHKITVYAPEGSTVEGAEIVSCISEHARIALFGKDDPNRLPAWPSDAKALSFNLMATSYILSRSEPRDIVLLVGGYTQNAIYQQLTGKLCVEPFIGYEGVIGGNVHGAYESYFHMAQVAWRNQTKDIRWYDRVIPPYCDPEEFPIVNDGKGDYLLFVGRLISRKGVAIASQIAKASGMKLIVAGAGGKVFAEGTVGAGDARWRLQGQDVAIDLELSADYKGPVGIAERAKLMAGARALLAPTLYAEPGGNVAIEAMMCGTPVIAPDWGVFSETVQDSQTGFHFRTLKQAVSSVFKLPILDNYKIRQRTIKQYSLTAARQRFNSWFSDLDALWDKGWNTL